MHCLFKDTEFQEILKILDNIGRIHKKNNLKIRKFLEAIYYITRSGCQWRLLPSCYGNWRSVHKRFKAWSDNEIWKKLFENLQIDPDLELIMIDSTIVRSHACSAGYGKNTQKEHALGRSKGGFTTKIHALVDALGNPLTFVLTPGQRNDITQAHILVEKIKGIPCLADKAYDADHFIKNLEDKGCVPIIPSRKNRIIIRDYDAHLYKERHLIECFFGKIKHFRRIFARYDKIAKSYLSYLYFVGALIWIR